MCPWTSSDTSNFKRFGNSFRQTCNVDIDMLFNEKPDTLFYELYIKKPNSEEFIDVPVAITNYLTDQNKQTNQNPRSQTDLTLSRRYVKYDVLTGVEGEGEEELKNNVPVAVRYLTSAILHVNTVNNDDQRIYRPYIILTYKEKLLENQDKSKGTQFTLSTDYNSEVGNFLMVGWTIFFILNVLVVLVVVVRLYIWSCYNPQSFNPSAFFPQLLLRVVAYVVTTWTFTMYFFLLSLSGYWFVFYKLQTKLFVFMPSISELNIMYTYYKFGFWIISVGMMFFYLLQIYDQSTIDVLFVDWERRRIFNRSDNLQSPEQAMKQGMAEVMKQKEKDLGKGSIWRTLLIANEFNEMSSQRYISMTFVYLVFCVLMIGLRFQNLAALTPFFTRDIGILELNYILKFFLTSFVLIGLAGLQYSFRRLIIIFFPTCLENFVDLCSIANISMFILDSPCHGYYIHGQSPVGAAEGTIEDLNRGFKAEQNDNCRSRGLLASDKTELQTFEIFIPHKIRETINTVRFYSFCLLGIIQFFILYFVFF